MQKAPALVLVALSAIAAPLACTKDYDQFNASGTGGELGDASLQGGAAGSAAGAAGSSAGEAGSAGTAGQAGQAGQAGAAAGAAGEGGAAGEAGTAGQAGGCNAGEKTCQNTCVSVSDPAYGCSDTGCDPCNLANATAACAGTSCSIESCTTGFADCNGSAADGCEAGLVDDSANCGACGTHCTGGLVCIQSLCSCDDNAPCSKSGASGTCTNAVCSCGGATCVAGETCEKVQGSDTCRCLGSTNCSAGQVCCPGSGCKDLQTDKDNCGACGRTCSQSCSNGVCT